MEQFNIYKGGNDNESDRHYVFVTLKCNFLCDKDAL